MGRKQQEGAALFLTAHLPEGLPRVSQADADTRSDILSAVLFPNRPSIYSLSAISCMSSILLHFPLAFHILIDYSFSPRYRVEFEDNISMLTCFCQFATFLCIVCCISMLRLTLRVQRPVTTDMGLLAVFLSGRSFVAQHKRISSLSLRRGKYRGVQASNHVLV